MSLENTTCPICGVGHLNHRVKRVVGDLAKYERVMEQPGFWCNHCEEGIINGSDLMATEPEMQAFRAFVREQHAKDSGHDRLLDHHPELLAELKPNRIAEGAAS
jgi:YgiT-type zinc finger domain-containing protein